MSISSANFSVRLRPRTKALLLGLVAICLLTLGVPLRAQDYLGQIGAPTFTTALPVELGILNVANGNLHLVAPVASFPQRGSVSYTAGLVYDSSIWVEAGTYPPSWQPTNVPNSWGGWRLAVSGAPGSTWFEGVTHLCDTPPPYHNYTTYVAFSWTAPDGTQHYFPGIQTERDSTDCDQGNIPNGDAFATDSSGYHMYVTNYTTVSAVYAPDGTQVYPAVKDTNGNYFSADSNGNIIDTLGRTPITKTTNGNTITYTVLNSQGSASTFTVTTTSISVSTSFMKAGVTEYSGTLTVIQKITLPDSTYYQFAYDSYGELNSVTLPTGGQITYSYTNFVDAFSNVGRWATSRSSAGGTWIYAPSVVASCGSEGPSCKQQVAVTKPSGDNAVYSFVLDNGGWNSQIQSYSGAVSPSNLLATSTTNWNLSNGCQGTGCTGNQNVQKMSQTLTMPIPGGSNISQTKQFTFDSINDSNVTKIQEWRFYSGSLPGTPDRETDITYLTGSSYALKNIINHVLSVVVCVPTGTPLSCKGSTNIGAQTNFAYDQSSLTSVLSIVHHDDANFGTANTTRGNLTQTQRWISASTNVSTNVSYDTTGQVLQSTDQASNSTTFSYADNFYNDNGANPPQPFTPSNATNAYLTGITVPIIGKTSRGYYFNTGKLAFSQDPNAANIYQHYLDSRDRLTHTYGPLINGVRSWTLRNYSSVTQEDYYQTIGDAQPSTGCTSCRHDRNAIDGFGNSVRRTLVSDPSAPVFIDEGYDSSGRLQTVSNPYRTTSDPTYGTETRTYDGLDRILTLTYADATVSKTFYGANVVGAGGLGTQLCSSSSYGLGYPMLEVNAARKMHQTWRDGFGRILEVDEPDSNNQLTRATCSTFNTVDALTQTTQGSQTRNFTYDELSRITSLSTPEGGTTTFYYSTAGGGLCAGDSSLICRRTDAQGITITYAYDALGRLTKKTYSDSTPTVQYFYDQSSYNGLSITNGIGRGTGMSDGSGATAWSYDPSGHVTSERRTIGSVTKLLQYGYTVSGLFNMITFPSGRTVAYSYNNAAQQISAIDGSGTNYANGALYAPTGMISGVDYGWVNGGFNGISESYVFNNRLELTRISASSSNGTAIDLSYQFSVPGGNDGNSASETNNRVPGRSVSWTYDPVDQISTAQSQDNSGPNCWGLSFAYDALSNLQSESVTKCSAPALSLTINGKNEITNSGFGSGSV